MSETFTHYARRVAAMLAHKRLTLAEAIAEIAPLRKRP
jgi:hypothetical protein